MRKGFNRPWFGFRRFYRAAELPKELEGKSAAEVATYYQNLVQVQKDTYEAALETLGGGEETPEHPNTPLVKKVTVGEFLADPETHTREMVQKEGVSRTEFLQASKAVQDMMVYTARERAMKELKAEADKRGDSFDWDRMEAPLVEISKKCDPASLTNIETWKTMYYYNRGQLTGTLVKEGVQKATMPMEPVAPGGNDDAPKTPLTAEEKTVAEGMGLTEDTYREGKGRMKAQKFGLTVDNRARR